MANILDYLDWRGDIPLSVDSFNLIDNLILSEMSYVAMEGLVSDDFAEHTVSIRNVSDRYFADKNYDFINLTARRSSRSPLLLKKAAESKRFKDIKMCDFVNEVDPDSVSQFAAVTFLLPDNTAFVSFRGTDHTAVGWQEDFNMSYMDETEGQRKAVRYLNYVLSKHKAVRVGGHSKGGNFSVYAASFCEDRYKDRILEIFTNDGPGFRDSVLEDPSYLGILPKVTSIIPKDSVVGMLLESANEDIIVDSNAIGLEQHDIFSWQVKGNDLVRLNQMGSWAEKFNEIFSEWISNISDEDRREYVNVVFSGIYDAIQKKEDATFDLKVIFKYIEKHVKDLPKEKQGAFKTLMNKLTLAYGIKFIKNFI
jgi:hypothetical protein